MTDPKTRIRLSVREQGAFVSRGFLLVAIGMFVAVGIGIAVFASVAG